MKIKVTKSHITADGPVRIGTVVDLPDDIAATFVSAGYAVPVVTPKKQTQSAPKPEETR